MDDYTKLMYCKAGAIAYGLNHGLSPLASLELFNNQLVKYAQKLGLPATFTNRDKQYLKFKNDMANHALENSQGILGFNVQDPMSKARIKAIINGLLAPPLTGIMAATEGAKRGIQKINTRIQSGRVPQKSIPGSPQA